MMCKELHVSRSGFYNFLSYQKNPKIKEVKDEDVSLDDKINHYTSVQMANNGNGVMIKGA